MDLETLKCIEVMLLDAQGRHDGLGNVISNVRARIAELEGRCGMTIAEGTALVQAKADAELKVLALEQQVEELIKKIKELENPKKLPIDLGPFDAVPAEEKLS